jgi:hypothetical protein
LFASGNYKKAAEYYAKSHYSFETVTMKFLKYKQVTGLEEYLKKVFDVYKKSKLGTSNDI